MAKHTRYQQDVLKSAAENHMWLNAFACVRPTDELAIQIGREVLRRLGDDEYTILSDFDGGPFESLKRRCLIMRFNKS